MHDKWICQTFWTKPMLKDEKFELLYNMLLVAGMSLRYAQRSGYKVRMHTDSIGINLLKYYGYNELVNTLDYIPNDIPSEFFAYGKALALKNEPIGTIHIDFDVLLKKPCLDSFFTNKSFDCIVQFEEGGKIDAYKNIQSTIKKLVNPPSEIPLSVIDPFNVGIIGFNNQKLKEEYIDGYFKCVDFCKDKKEIIDIHYKGSSPDLWFEQERIAHLVKDGNYNCLKLLDYWNYDYVRFLKLNKEADNIGYQHIQCVWKNGEEARQFFEYFFKRNMPKFLYVIRISFLEFVEEQKNLVAVQ